jgi:hypothetical protein
MRVSLALGAGITADGDRQAFDAIDPIFLHDGGTKRM